MRRLLRDQFFEMRLLDKVASDLGLVMQGPEGIEERENDMDREVATPAGLWDPGKGVVTGGVNYAEPEE
jgi:hypothetical protein